MARRSRRRVPISLPAASVVLRNLCCHGLMFAGPPSSRLTGAPTWTCGAPNAMGKIEHMSMCQGLAVSVMGCWGPGYRTLNCGLRLELRVYGRGGGSEKSREERTGEGERRRGEKRRDEKRREEKRREIDTPVCARLPLTFRPHPSQLSDLLPTLGICRKFVSAPPPGTSVVFRNPCCSRRAPPVAVHVRHSKTNMCQSNHFRFWSGVTNFKRIVPCPAFRSQPALRRDQFCMAHSS